MKVALVVCTHNRSEVLSSTLDSLNEQTKPEDLDLEVIVVANACTDATLDVSNRHVMGRAVKVLVEPKPGLSHARNIALEYCLTAGFSWLIWSDDDVLFGEQYLKSYHRVFSDPLPTPVIGGRILPHFVAPSPDWLGAAIGALGIAIFSCLDHGNESALVPVSRGQPFGANMAIRLCDVGSLRFDPNWGVTPTRKLGFEETIFIDDLLGAGSNWHYEPQALVEHVMPVRRQSRAAISQYLGAQGYASALRESPDPTMSQLFGKPRWTYRALAVRWFHVQRWSLSKRNSEEYFSAWASFEIMKGYRRAFSDSGSADLKGLIR